MNPTILAVALALVAVPAALFFYIVLRYVPIIERNAFEVPRYQVPQPPATVPGGIEESLSIPGPDGSRIESLYVRSRQADRKLVIFCHQTLADASSWRRYAYFLPSSGIDVLSFDLEGGMEPYQWPTREELGRLLAVLEWVSREKKGYPVGLFGVSKGAAVAFGAFTHPLVRCLALDGVFSTVLTLEKYIQRWLGIYVMNEKAARTVVPRPMFGFLARLAMQHAEKRKGRRFYSVEDLASDPGKAVLFIHAEKDPMIRLDGVQYIKTRCRGKSDLWVVPGAGHTESVRVRPEEYARKLTGFFKEHLG